MVTELKEVLAEIEQLNSDEQKWLAYLLRQELLWNNTFKKSQRQLSQLGDEAVTELRMTKTYQIEACISWRIQSAVLITIR